MPGSSPGMTKRLIQSELYVNGGTGIPSFALTRL